MKKHYYIYIVLALALATSLPVAVRAQEDTDDSATLPPAQETMQKPPVPPQGTAPRPGAPVPAALREQLRNKNENIQNNVEVRNKMLENRRVGTSTRPMIASTTRMERKDIRDERREDVMDLRREGREDIRNATNTQERREIRRDMRKDIFEVRKNALLKQLAVSVENLKQVRDRIASRIEKAAATGRDMTAAKSALVTADAKITAALAAIDTFKSYTPPAPSATSTDQSVGLDKPRQVADAALKAVKDAHESLTVVVRAIARAMGLGGNASTTPTTTP